MEKVLEGVGRPTVLVYAPVGFPSRLAPECLFALVTSILLALFCV